MSSAWRRNRTGWRRFVNGACPHCGDQLWRLRWNHVRRCERWATAQRDNLRLAAEVFITVLLVLFLATVYRAG